MRSPFAAALVGLLLVASAFAQDPPTTPRPPPPQKAQAPAPIVDPEARAASDEARAARERGNCLIRAAQAVDSAARRLSEAQGRGKQGRRGALDHARAELALCDTPGALGTASRAEAALEVAPTAPTIENIAVEWPSCPAGDPLCNDSTTFDAAPIVRTIRRHRAGFTLCNEQRPSSRAGGHVRLLLKLAEIGDDARPTSVQVEEDTLKDPRATSCLSRSAARLVFPSATSAAQVRLTVRMPKR